MNRLARVKQKLTYAKGIIPRLKGLFGILVLGFGNVIDNQRQGCYEPKLAVKTIKL